jgi:aquaporin Z
MSDRETSRAAPDRGGVLGYLDARVEGVVRDFYDPRFEGRRLFSELLGTFFLVVVAAGGAVVNAQSGGQIPLAVRVTAPGLMVMAMILFMGGVSGAHFNPVVSVGFAMRGDFPWKRVPGYVIAQLIGSILAVLFLRATLGNIGGLGATEPGPGISATTAIIFEAVLTLGLLSTILGTASGAQNIGVFGALGVGAYIALAGLWSAPISGASMNPARSLGPMIVGGNYHDWWVYIVGPFIGGIAAVGVAWILRGRGGGISAKMAAQGDVKLDVADPSSVTKEAPPE